MIYSSLSEINSRSVNDDLVSDYFEFQFGIA